jgi:HAMP domain-containing protein
VGIRTRFLIIMGILSLLALVALGAASYEFSRRAAMIEAGNKGEIIFNYLQSQRHFFQKNQIPLINELIEKDRFYPNLMSGFAATSTTFDYFNQRMPGFTIKYAATNPLKETNRADNFEVQILDKFKADQKLKETTGTITKNGIDFYFQAIPLKVDNPACLECHSDPALAPKDQVAIYGTESGYSWKMNEIVASLFVYIPISGAIAQAKQTAMTLLGIGAGCLIFTLIVISIFLEKGVVQPIMRLNSRTEEISLGKSLDQPVVIKSNDEIGSLSRAIDRLRISVARMLTRR